MTRIGIIGGGISGLATAFSIQFKAAERGQPVQITLLEAEERLGGVISTERVQGFTCESGPTGVMDSWPRTLEVCEHIGIQDLMVASQPGSERLYICRSGQLHQFPNSLRRFLTFRAISLPGRLRLLKEPWSRPAPSDDETIADFGRRHLGPEATAVLCDGMAASIFAGDIEALSLRSSFPFAAQLDELGDGSLLRGGIRYIRNQKTSQHTLSEEGDPWLKRGRFVSFQGGTQTFVRYLANAIGDSMLLGKRVQRIEKETSGKTFLVHIAGEETSLEFNALVLATPAYASASMLEEYDASIARTLAEIQYVPLTLVHLGYPRKNVSDNLDGFGFLVPFGEPQPLIGVQYMSSIYAGMAPAGQVLFRAWIGGAHRPELAALGDEALADMVHEAISPMLGISARPTFANCTRHAKAFPQYTVGHARRLQRVDELMEKHRGLYLTGNAYYGATANDCVHNSFKIADRVLRAAAGQERAGVGQ